MGHEPNSVAAERAFTQERLRELCAEHRELTRKAGFAPFQSLLLRRRKCSRRPVRHPAERTQSIYRRSTLPTQTLVS